ncbi:diguanylate cyclase domain-containing protein [Kineococcus sp. SYSU DK002]|uniref:diguanylate cyclase domain-containing protein n=1 Tax=Kineococcus sp. SYSU DK002 TaxID=3383123 RepID=UPI003D7CBAEC
MRTGSSDGRAALSASGRLGADFGVLALAVVALAVAQAVLGRGTTPALLVVGLAEAVAAFAAAVALARTGWRTVPAGWSRRSCLLLALACASWGAGQLLYVTQDVLDLDASATTLADGPFFAYSVLAVVSMSAHLWDRGRSHLGVGALLDGLLLGTSLFTVLWVVSLGHAVRVSGSPAAELVLPLTYPVLDVVYLTAAIVQLARLGVTGVGVLCVLAAGAMSVADATYFYGVLAVEGFQTGGVADFGWVVAFGVFAIGARYRRVTTRRQRAPSPGSWGWLVPYAAMLPATALGAARLWGTTDRLVLVALLLMAVLVMGRQFLALDDHRRLLATAERQRRLLDAVAHVDPLTGLENRRRFADRIADAVRRGLETGSPVVVAFVDLDGFKAVNDTLGHAAGDDLLRGVAVRLRTCVREVDCAARWGGDEFAVLVTDPGADADGVAGRLRDAFGEPFVVAGAPLRASASVGAVREDPRRLLAALPPGGDPVPEVVEALLAAADARMYAVKRARRGTVGAER